MNKYVVVVECAIECDGKYLIIRRPEDKYAGGLLSFAGGKVEEQDHLNSFGILQSAIKREVFEELGLNLTGNVNYVTSEYFVDDLGVCSINNLFSYKYKEIPLVTPSEREVPWFAWLTKEEIHAAPNSPVWLKTLIELV